MFFSSALSRVQVVGENSVQHWSSTPMSVGIQQSIGRPNIAAWDAEERDINADIGEKQYLEAREGVAISTASAFFDFYAAKLALANAENNASVNDSLYTLNKGRFEVGKIGENDLQQSELTLLRGRISLDGARLEYDRSLSALRIQLNLPPGVPVDVLVSAAVPDVTVDTALAVAQAVRNSSQTRLQDFRTEQARRRLSEAKYNTGLSATISASVGFNQSGTEAGQVYQNLLQAQQYSLAVSVPLIQWGLRSSLIQAAHADQDGVTGAVTLAREQTVQDAHFAALGLSQAARQLAIAAKADTVASNRFEVAKNRYIIGKIGIDVLVVAQTDKDSSLLAYVQSLRGYWSAYYRLRQVTLYDFEKGERIQ
jgi:outer membrane protein TolC